MKTRIATAAGAGPDVRFFVPFAKVSENADGSVYVEGIATAEIKDFHGEIVSHEASVQAFGEWTDWAAKATDGASLGNIRVMHGSNVAGTAVNWTHDESAKTNSIGAQLIDVDAGKKAKARAYTGFSIGGSNVKREMRTVDGKQVPVITSYRLNEVSLVDKPACPVATFTLVKRASKETPMKLLELLKSNLSAVLAIAAKMTDEKTITNGETVLTVNGIEKDATEAGTAALASLKSFLVEGLAGAGDPDLWTIGDICEAMRYCYSARMGVQYAIQDAAEDGMEASASADLKKSDTPAEPPADPPVETEATEEEESDPVPPVPPEVPEDETQPEVDLSPVLNAVASLAASIEPLVKAFQEGSLTKAAGTQDLTKLEADVSEVKAILKSLPAPPPGRAISKSLGDASGTAAPNMDAFVKIADEALAKAAASGTPQAAIDAMRLSFVAEAMKRI